MVVPGANSELPRKLFRDSLQTGFLPCMKHDCLNRKNGGDMERLLLKVAEKINSCDEASLTDLWEKYHARTAEFEATARWEQDVLVLTILQGVRWKNRLFNHGLADRMSVSNIDSNVPKKDRETLHHCPDSGPTPVFSQENRGKILHFRPRQGDEPV